MVLGIFKIALRLRDGHIFPWLSVKVLNVFKTLKQIFWKTKTFLKKLEYSFLVESTKIENVSFPYKTATSEANVKTNSLLTTKWTYHKERSFLFIYFFFWKFCFGLTTSYKKLMCCTNNPNVIIFVHFASAGVLFHGAFSLWVSLKHPDMQVWFATYLKRFPFFYLQSFCFVLPFWITNLKANNFSRKIILKRQ